MRKKHLSLTLSFMLAISTFAGCKSAFDNKSTTEAKTSLIITTETTETASTEATETTEATTTEEQTTEATTEEVARSVKYVNCSVAHMSDSYFVDEEIASNGIAYTSLVSQVYIAEEELPALKKAMNNLNEELQDELSEQLNYIYGIMGDESFDFSKSNIPWYDTSSIQVMRSDTMALSMFKTHSQNLNYPSPSIVITGLNYDSETGKKLSLSDVVKDVDAFYADVITELKKTDTSKYCDNYADIASDLFYNTDSFDAWILTATGIEVCFNQNTIAPAGVEEIIIKVEKDDYPDLFNDAYFYSEMESSPEEGAPVFYNKAGELYNGLFLSLASDVDIITFTECIEKVKESGYEYEIDEINDDSYGIIRITKGDEKLYLSFVPKDLNATPGTITTDDEVLLNVEYRISSKNCGLLFGRYTYDDDYLTYSYIDYSYHTRTVFDSEYDLSGAYLNGMNN